MLLHVPEVLEQLAGDGPLASSGRAQDDGVSGSGSGSGRQASCSHTRHGGSGRLESHAEGSKHAHGEVDRWWE